MKNFNSYTNCVDLQPVINLCRTKGKLCHFSKGDVIVQKGMRLKSWGFIINGYFKYVVTDSDGSTHVTGFSFNESLVGNFLSFVGYERMYTDIIAATPADVIICDTSVLRAFLDENPCFCRNWAISLFRQAYTQYLEIHVKSPKERYQAILDRCPGLLNNITLKDMASYLRITPTHLSRIRKEITFT